MINIVLSARNSLETQFKNNPKLSFFKFNYL